MHEAYHEDATVCLRSQSAVVALVNTTPHGHASVQLQRQPEGRGSRHPRDQPDRCRRANVERHPRRAYSWRAPSKVTSPLARTSRASLSRSGVGECGCFGDDTVWHCSLFAVLFLFVVLSRSTALAMPFMIPEFDHQPQALKLEPVHTYSPLVVKIQNNTDLRPRLCRTARSRPRQRSGRGKCCPAPAHAPTLRRWRRCTGSVGRLPLCQAHVDHRRLQQRADHVEREVQASGRVLRVFRE